MERQNETGKTIKTKNIEKVENLQKKNLELGKFCKIWKLENCEKLGNIGKW